jgi:hypothetical protein
MDRALHRAAKRTISAAGEQVMLTLREGGNLLNVWAHITRDIELTEGETRTGEFRNEVEMLAAEVSELTRDDKIVTGTGTVWKIEERLANDGYTCKAVIMDVTDG